MGVLLRYRTLKGGDRRYYLLIHHNGKRWKEHLQARIKKSGYDKKDQKELKILLEKIRNLRERELLAGDFGLDSNLRGKIDFSEYFRKYAGEYKKKDVRKIQAAYKQYLKHFGTKPIWTNQIKLSHCEKFMDHLKDNLKGESPHSYFSAFRKVIRSAVKEGFMRENPTEGIRVSKGEPKLVKDVLTIDELQLLAGTYCGNEQVKRAFLVACFTGQGYTDIKAMTWNQVKDGEIHYRRSKTTRKNKAKVIIPVKSFVIYLCGERGGPTGKIFTLPSANGCNKVLKYWVKRAGIDKHITFYSARHSFGCNLMLEGDANERTVADLLGHSDLQYVQRYTQHVDELKAKAVAKIPELMLNTIRIAKTS